MGLVEGSRGAGLPLGCLDVVALGALRDFGEEGARAGKSLGRKYPQHYHYKSLRLKP